MTDATPNPSGGEVVRDSQGHAAGVLVDAAMDLVFAVQPAPSPSVLPRRWSRARA